MRRSVGGFVVAALLSGALVAGAPAPAEAATCRIGTPSATYAQQVALSAGHAQVWRLYQAFFLRQPDQAGLDYWIDVRAEGARLTDLAYSFAGGTEFRKRYGSLGRSAFVDLVYRNVLCRKPDAEGKAYWVGQLRSGKLSRWDLMINFAELREYLRRTGTCHSTYPGETLAVAACPQANLRPLSKATMSTDGYRARHVAVHRWSGGTGSFRGVEVDFSRGILETGARRCSVASINTNWLVGSQKDAPNPAVLGLGVVDGVHRKGSSDRADRGVLGLRFDAHPAEVVEVWPGDTESPDDTRLSSVLHHAGLASLESWHAAAETSPYLQHLAPQEMVGANEWVWAVAGIPLIVDGQADKDFMAAWRRDPYTYQTWRHTFAAFDQHSGRMLFGGTTDLDSRDLLGWAQANGYEDLVKFDGGGSTEFNVDRRAVVGGTGRDIPIWLGIGC